ncbi:serine/threonine protein kinase [Aliiglaciecola aliphaticivorans]
MTRELQPGNRIHRYVIEKVLGSGGFGVVYLAQHASLEYRVVIKEYLPNQIAHRVDGVVKPFMADLVQVYETALQQFKHECETLLTLDHENIVYVYDCFYEAGTAYMVMHQEIGNTLWESYVQQVETYNQPFTWQQVGAVLPGVMAGLDYLHQQNLVHRDMKASNVFLRSGSELHPILIDFGAVKVAGGYVSQQAQNTQSYAALEQEYNVFPIGPWTDIHALGVMIIELLTGQRPIKAFDRHTQSGNGGSDPILMLLEQVAHYCGEDLANALFYATQLQPEHRYQNISEFKAALPL